MIRRRVGLWFCRVMEWHQRPYVGAILVNGFQMKATCARCRKTGIVDSQGNLF